MSAGSSGWQGAAQRCPTPVRRGHLPASWHAEARARSPEPATLTLRCACLRRRNGGGATNGGALSWLSPDERTREPFSADPEAAWQLAQDYDLCITGALRCWQYRRGTSAVTASPALAQARWRPPCPRQLQNAAAGAGWAQPPALGGS